MLSCAMRPSISQIAAQSAEPARLYPANTLNGVRIVPSSAEDTVDSPGTNFEINSSGAPQRSNCVRVRRTQESGDSDTRHSSAITCRP